MLAYRFNSTLFTHVIAATSIVEAVRQSAILLESRTVQGPTSLVVPWHGTDAWTRRAIESAMSPGVIDTIPRFVVDRKDGPVYLDIDDIITELGIGPERTKCINDSEAHDAWYAACLAESLRGDALRSYIRNLVEIDDSGTYPFHARALAGAWGLGPIPEWHAAILPALIALDIELGTFPPDVFELDRDNLGEFLFSARTMKCHNADHYRAVVSLQLAVRHGDHKTLYDAACSTLKHLGWLR